MDDSPQHSGSRESATAYQRIPALRRRANAVRLPSTRISALLAAATLAAGVGIGAAIGPAPEPSLAGNSAAVESLPALIAGLSQRSAAQTPAPSSSSASPAGVLGETPLPARRTARVSATPTTSASAPTQTPAAATTPASETESAASTKPKSPAASKLPPITSVWLIELSGTSFADAQATPAAAPYITGQLIPKATLLSGWSALEGNAFANDAALAPHRPTLGATPPVLHSYVQSACPEGSPCSSGPGQLTAADEFVKAAVATITATTTYAEHGLIVVTFASVATSSASELPAGSSSATLGTQPPTGVLLLSNFAKAGATSSVAFNATSPMQALSQLLH